MSIFGAMLTDADDDPFTEIPKLCDAGRYVLNTGVRSIVKGGVPIRYGPIVDVTLAYYPDRVEAQFADPKPQASAGCRAWATIDKLTFTKDDQVVASGRVMGVKFSKKIQVSDA